MFGADLPPVGPAPMPVNTFGMPEILPNPPLHDGGTYLPNGGLPDSSRDGGGLPDGFLDKRCPLQCKCHVSGMRAFQYG